MVAHVATKHVRGAKTIVVDNPAVLPWLAEILVSSSNNATVKSALEVALHTFKQDALLVELVTMRASAVACLAAAAVDVVAGTGLTESIALPTRITAACLLHHILNAVASARKEMERLCVSTPVGACWGLGEDGGGGGESKCESLVDSVTSFKKSFAKFVELAVADALAIKPMLVRHGLLEALRSLVDCMGRCCDPYVLEGLTYATACLGLVCVGDPDALTRVRTHASGLMLAQVCWLARCGTAALGPTAAGPRTPRGPAAPPEPASDSGGDLVAVGQLVRMVSPITEETWCWPWAHCGSGSAQESLQLTALRSLAHLCKGCVATQTRFAEMGAMASLSAVIEELVLMGRVTSVGGSSSSGAMTCRVLKSQHGDVINEAAIALGAMTSLGAETALRALRIRAEESPDFLVKVCALVAIGPAFMVGNLNGRAVVGRSPRPRDHDVPHVFVPELDYQGVASLMTVVKALGPALYFRVVNLHILRSLCNVVTVAAANAQAVLGDTSRQVDGDSGGDTSHLSILMRILVGCTMMCGVAVDLLGCIIESDPVSLAPLALDTALLPMLSVVVALYPVLRETTLARVFGIVEVCAGAVGPECSVAFGRDLVDCGLHDQVTQFIMAESCREAGEGGGAEGGDGYEGDSLAMDDVCRRYMPRVPGYPRGRECMEAAVRVQKLASEVDGVLA